MATAAKKVIKVHVQARKRLPSLASPKEGERIRFSASLILQGEKQFFSVTIPTNVLSQCCFVTTRNEDPEAGFQRVLDKKRAQDIADYIDTGAGTIPGSIILSAQDDAQLKLIGGGKTIEFTLAKRAFLVLDGQHRVYGFSLADKAFRVPVVIYSELTAIEEARLFIDINTKQRPVPNELLLDIKQLALREDDKLKLMRDIFDLFADHPHSSLMGLMSPSARQANKISRVTFNLAFKSVLPVFSAKDPASIFQVTNAYVGAFSDLFAELELNSVLVKPAVFRAVMDTFPEVARISAAQYGKNFNKSRFAAVLNPIAESMTPAKFRSAVTVKDMSTLFAKLIKKDFSI